MAKAKKSKGKIIIAAVIVAAALISALIPQSVWNGIFIKTGLKNPEFVSSPMTVHFVDVGQGDCAVITTDRGETVLIDSGEEIKAQSVIDYLEKISVKKIDYCIVTHPHSDHYGGMLKILRAVPAKRVVMPYLEKNIIPDDGYYDKLVSFAKSECKSISFVKSDCKINLKNAELQITVPITQRTDLNNMSLVVKAVCGKVSFLITGDCSAEEERELLKAHDAADFRCNILKAGHHGSSTASSDEWLNAASPDVCVISAGRYNSYNLPSTDFLETLEKRDIQYYRTDICGTLVFDCEENATTLRTAQEE